MANPTSFSTLNAVKENSAVSQPTLTQGALNGRKAVQVDASYANKKDFSAGVGPEMFNGLGSMLIAIGLLFTTVVATAAVGIASLSLSTAGITFGILLGAGALILLSIKVLNPRF